MKHTKIEWTDETWNPMRGCSRVSEGCRNCYAEKMAGRFCGEGQPYEGLAKRTKKGARWTGEGEFVSSKLDEPLRWREPRMVFVNSMSDVFFEKFGFEEIAAVFGVMAAASTHTFQVLTKRPARAREFFEWLEEQSTVPSGVSSDSTARRRHVLYNAARRSGVEARRLPAPGGNNVWPLPNVWLGVSAEDQETAEERVPLLLELPAEVRFVSAEPLLGPINFENIEIGESITLEALSGCISNELTGERTRTERIDWIIVGGESGPGARVCEEQWIESIVEQGHHDHAPIFVKQLGKVWAKENGATHSKGGEMDEWPEVLRVRKFPGTVSSPETSAGDEASERRIASMNKNFEELARKARQSSENTLFVGEDATNIFLAAFARSPTDTVLERVKYELVRVRTMHPNPDRRMAVILEEVGEVCEALVAGEGNWREEAIQAAAALVRLAVEGGEPECFGDDRQTHPEDLQLMHAMMGIGEVARNLCDDKPHQQSAWNAVEALTKMARPVSERG